MLARLKDVLAPPGESERPARRVVESAGWLFFDRVVRMGVGMIVGVWLARYLGPEAYGSLNYAIAFAGLFGALATLGLDNIVVRDLVREPAEEGSTLGTATLLRLLAGLVTAAAATATFWLLHRADSSGLLLVGIVAAVGMFQAFDGIEAFYQAQVQPRAAVLAKTVASLLGSTLRAVLILRSAPLVAFALAVLAEAVLNALSLAVIYGATRLLRWRFKFSRARQLLHDGWPLILSSLVIMIYLRIDVVMLGQMAGRSEVGVYSVAVKLAELLYLVPTALVAAWLPSIVEAHRAGEDLFYTRLQRLYNIMALLGYAVAIPAIFLAAPTIRLLFGTAYLAAAPMSVVLAFASMFVNLGVARSAFLTTVNWPRTHLFTVALGAFCNIALNLWLIPRYGGLGAAIASLIAYWLAAHGACFLLPGMSKTGAMMLRSMIFPKVW